LAGCENFVGNKSILILELEGLGLLHRMKYSSRNQKTTISPKCVNIFSPKSVGVFNSYKQVTLVRKSRACAPFS